MSPSSEEEMETIDGILNESLRVELEPKMSTNAENQERYYAACHAMQSGVAMEIGQDEVFGSSGSASSPKHLRTGVNTALVDNGAITSLLVKRGIITWEEVWQALADGMEGEVKKYEDRINKSHPNGPQVHLV